MRYARAKWREYQDSLAYRIYITDSLQAYAQGKYLTKRFADMILPHKTDERTGTEIALDVIAKAGLKMEK